ncbi:hypothetical protein ACAH01_01240 [Halomicrobium sp. HM KBTZ05]|uniref:hypothetical protein n=1 Tax=Halomicrobium sp. HM KBTZ05 TaxID=3242663 RepID=UPI003555D0F0
MAYHAVGLFLLAGVAIAFALWCGLVSPGAFVLLFTVLALSDHVISGPEFSVLYLGWWFTFLVPIVVAAVLEYGARTLLQVYPPKPLV